MQIRFGGAWYLTHARAQTAEMNFELIQKRIDQFGKMSLSLEQRVFYQAQLTERRFERLLRPSAAPRVLPRDGWKIAAPEKIYEIADLQNLFDGNPLRQRNESFDNLLLQVFIRICAPLFRRTRTEWYDSDLFLCLAFDVWHRTNREARLYALTKLFSKCRNQHNDVSQARARAFAPLRNQPGLGKIKRFHQMVHEQDDLSFATAAEAAYNAALRKLTRTPRCVVLDEAVLQSTAKLHVRHAKPKQSGPQFYELAYIVPQAHVPINCCLHLCVHRAGQGPSVATTAKRMLAIAGYLDDDLAVGDRPLLIADSHFSSHEFVHFLLGGDPVLGFVLSFKENKLRETYKWLDDELRRCRRGVLPHKWTGSVLYFCEGNPFPIDPLRAPQHNAIEGAAATSSTSGAATSSTASTRKSSRTTAGKRVFDEAFVIDSEDMSDTSSEQSDDNAEPQSEPTIRTKQRIAVEMYQGQGEQERLHGQIAYISNYLIPVDRHDRTASDPKG